jgi:hypothetical protein
VSLPSLSHSPTTKPEDQITAELDLATTILCTHAIANGAIYIRSDGKLWKLVK